MKRQLPHINGDLPGQEREQVSAHSHCCRVTGFKTHTENAVMSNNYRLDNDHILLS